MDNTGIIITLAYPETIVRVSTERFVQYLRFIGIGTKNYVRAGHAAIVLIHKDSKDLDYFDFGRYIIPKPNGRVRSKLTDNELDFSIKPEIENGIIKNLNEILKFFATNPKLTHGEGKMVASVCYEIDYDKAKNYIKRLQDQYFVPYAVFKKNASNCSRFVTSTLIASITNERIKKKLINSTWFTPSTVGNVVLSSSNGIVYEVSQTGEISDFQSTTKRENIKYFLDSLKGYSPNLVGNLEPTEIMNNQNNMQWMSGIGAGAWFELQPTTQENEFLFKRISPYGTFDVQDIFVINKPTFNNQESFEFLYHSNCSVIHIKQSETIYKFTRKEVSIIS